MLLSLKLPNKTSEWQVKFKFVQMTRETFKDILNIFLSKQGVQA